MSEDTRFTNPLDDYRGMSITGYHFTPYLHVNPQSHIQTNKHRDGAPSRLIVRDTYGIPKQNYWDKGEALPPKPKPVKPYGCKACCN